MDKVRTKKGNQIMSARVAIKSFSYRHEAELVRELLRSEGIDAVVTSDDCGSVDPSLALATGVYVTVWEEDLERASSIINQAESEPRL
jgi:hypothetical protein